MEMVRNVKLEIVLMFRTCLPRSSLYRSVKLYHLVRTNIDIGRFNNNVIKFISFYSICLSCNFYNIESLELEVPCWIKHLTYFFKDLEALEMR